MKSLFYKFYPFKDPIYLIAWNAVLAGHTFRCLSKEMKFQVTMRTMFLLKRSGRADAVVNGCPMNLYLFFIAFGLAEEGIRPDIGDPDVRWYPVDKPELLLSQCGDKFEMMAEKVRYDVKQRYGIELPDFARMDGDLNTLLRVGEDG